MFKRRKKKKEKSGEGKKKTEREAGGKHLWKSYFRFEMADFIHFPALNSDSAQEKPSQSPLYYHCCLGYSVPRKKKRGISTDIGICPAGRRRCLLVGVGVGVAYACIHQLSQRMPPCSLPGAFLTGFLPVFALPQLCRPLPSCAETRQRVPNRAKGFLTVPRRAISP